MRFYIQKLSHSVRPMFVAAFVVALAATPFVAQREAQAQWAVIDGANLTQNILQWIEEYTQTAKQYMQYAKQVEQYTTQLEQLRYQVASLKQLSGDQVDNLLQTRALDKQYGHWSNYSRALNRTLGSLSTLHSVLAREKKEFAHPKRNPDGTIDRHALAQAMSQQIHRVGATGRNATISAREAMVAAQGNIARLHRYEAKLSGGTPSLQGSMQAMNSGLDLIAHQNQQMLALVAANVASESAARTHAVAATTTRNTAGKAHMKKLAAANARMHAGQSKAAKKFHCIQARQLAARHWTKAQLDAMAKAGIDPYRLPAGCE